MSNPPMKRRTFVLIGAAVAMAAGARVPMAAAATSSAPAGTPTPVRIVDDKATPATRALFAYLKRQQGKGILFGHQHDLTYGFTFTTPDGKASDTRAAVGDHPAVFGWDTLILDGDERPGVPNGTEAENIAALSRCIRQGDARGGINTLSAHMPNFVTDGNFYDTRGRVVGQILPGGSEPTDFKAFLDRIAKAVKGARRPDGTPIPVIFRPFHENNAGWFWWRRPATPPRASTSSCTATPSSTCATPGASTICSTPTRPTPASEATRPATSRPTRATVSSTSSATTPTTRTPDRPPGWTVW